MRSRRDKGQTEIVRLRRLGCVCELYHKAVALDSYLAETRRKLDYLLK
jgi:hypothetical protein